MLLRLLSYFDIMHNFYYQFVTWTWTKLVSPVKIKLYKAFDSLVAHFNLQEHAKSASKVASTSLWPHLTIGLLLHRAHQGLQISSWIGYRCDDLLFQLADCTMTSSQTAPKTYHCLISQTKPWPKLLWADSWWSFFLTHFTASWCYHFLITAIWYVF